MATAPISIPPVLTGHVLTPHTLGILANALENAEPQKAAALRKLQPVVEGIVSRCFLPLTSYSTKTSFSSRLSKLSRDFEPFRLYLNVVMLTTLQSTSEGQQLLNFYEEIFHEAFE